MVDSRENLLACELDFLFGNLPRNHRKKNRGDLATVKYLRGEKYSSYSIYFYREFLCELKKWDPSKRLLLPFNIIKNAVLSKLHIFLHIPGILYL